MGRGILIVTTLFLAICLNAFKVGYTLPAIFTEEIVEKPAENEEGPVWTGKYIITLPRATPQLIDEICGTFLNIRIYIEEEEKLVLCEKKSSQEKKSNPQDERNIFRFRRAAEADIVPTAADSTAQKENRDPLVVSEDKEGSANKNNSIVENEVDKTTSPKNLKHEHERVPGMTINHNIKSQEVQNNASTTTATLENADNSTIVPLTNDTETSGIPLDSSIKQDNISNKNPLPTPTTPTTIQLDHVTENSILLKENNVTDNTTNKNSNNTEIRQTNVTNLNATTDIKSANLTTTDSATGNETVEQSTVSISTTNISNTEKEANSINETNIPQINSTTNQTGPIVTTDIAKVNTTEQDTKTVSNSTVEEKHTNITAKENVTIVQPSNSTNLLNNNSTKPPTIKVGKKLDQGGSDKPTKSVETNEGNKINSNVEANGNSADATKLQHLKEDNTDPKIGESKTSKGATDTYILVFLFGAIGVIALAFFGYRYMKRRRNANNIPVNRSESTGRKLATYNEKEQEMKPLIRTNGEQKSDPSNGDANKEDTHEPTSSSKSAADNGVDQNDQSKVFNNTEQ